MMIRGPPPLADRRAADGSDEELVEEAAEVAEDGPPPLAGDRSDEELVEDEDLPLPTGNRAPEDLMFDTDEELWYDDRYVGRGATCRGEREGVLGVERHHWDPVAWALNTSPGGMVLDPSRHKQCREDDTISHGRSSSSEEPASTSYQGGPGCKVLPSSGSESAKLKLVPMSANKNQRGSEAGGNDEEPGTEMQAGGSSQ